MRQLVKRATCALVVICLVGCPEPDRSPDAVDFSAVTRPLTTPTGALAKARYRLAAVELLNGKVLVLGNGAVCDRTAELYDPASGTFSPTAQSGKLHGAYFSATRLADGAVLVAGGNCGSQDAEIYEPATNLWRAAASMPVRRFGHTATLLADGRVLVVGGSSDAATPSASAGLFDPVSNTWSATGSLATARTYHTATMLTDGRVLVAGGQAGDGTAISTAEVFDSSSSTWSAAGTLQHGRESHLSFALSGGRALVAGGIDSAGQVLRSTEVFNPTTNAWSASGDLNYARRLMAGLSDASSGRVYVSGGQLYTEHSSVERFDVATGLWTVLSPGGTTRFLHTMAWLPGGRMLIAGGIGSPTRVALSSAEIYEDTATCAKGSCEALGRQCGYVMDSCGGQIQCPGCASGQICNWSTYQCETCTPMACGAPGMPACGLFPDGCGGTVDCGGCPDGQTCRWGECCQPTTCTAQGKNCGAIADGCGATLECGGCAPGWVCFNNACACAPTTCAAQGKSCGSVSDGCGGALECGTCPAGWMCADGACVCAPTTCAAQGKNCGALFDGCGATLECGTCAAGWTCADNVCACVPTTCAAQGKDCGTLPDGCGGTLECGTCAAGWTCADNVCACAPTTCAALGESCGTLPDGCGGILECGACAPGYQCVANACLVTDAVAAYDATLKAPRCPVGRSCDSGTLLAGRGTFGPESGAPNTINNACADGNGTVQRSIDRLRITSADGLPLAGGYAANLVATIVASSSPYADSLDLYYAADAANPIWSFIGTLTPTVAGSQDLSISFTLPMGSLQAIRANFRYGGGLASPCSPGSQDDHDDLVFAAVLPPDLAPPTTSVTTPTAGATLLNNAGFVATASDDVGVVRMEIYVDSTLIGAASTSPCNASWNTRAMANGSHVVTSKAYDGAGKMAASAPVTVTFNNDFVAPTTALTSPSAGATVSGWVTLAASASDNAGISYVEFYSDSTLLGRSWSAPYSFAWNSRTTTNGSHALTSRAYDTSTNWATSTAVNVTVNNDFTPPTTTLTAPVAGAIVSGTVTLTATASDNLGVARVDFYDSTTLLGSRTVPPYSVSWNTTTATNGNHTLLSQAFDEAGNLQNSPGVTVTVNNPVPGTATYNATLRTPKCSSVAASCDSGTLLTGRAALGPEANAPNTLNGSCSDGGFGTYHSDESLDRLKVSTLDGSPLAAGKAVRIEATVWAWSSTADKLDLYYAANASSPTWVRIVTLSPTATGSQTLSANYILPTGATQAIRGTFRYLGSAGACTSGSYDDHDDLVFVTQ
ncbi:MAG: Ig-like domain-containing protein [Myxococcales bacterium]